MLLPSRQRVEEIHFHFGKNLTYGWRLVLSLCLIVSGLAIQMIGPAGAFLVGLPLVLAGVLLLLVKGYHNTVEQKLESLTWRPCDRKDVERILQVNQAEKQWDKDYIDVTNVRGVVSLVFVVIVLAGIYYFVESHYSYETAALLVANAVVLLLPFWITGVRFILKNDQLVIKAQLLLKLETAFQTFKKEGEEFQFQMQTVPTENDAGEVPYDVKALLHLRDSPHDFLGVQLQIAINQVQGSNYPYFYCVLVTRKEFGGLTARQLQRPPLGIIRESEQEQDVDIVVIRQKTSKNSGYHTDFSTSRKILKYALSQARRIQAKSKA